MADGEEKARREKEDLVVVALKKKDNKKGLAFKGGI